MQESSNAATAAWWAFGLAALALLVSFPNLGDWCSLSPDSLQYLDVARELFENHRFPTNPGRLPPGFPILIAPLMAQGDFPFLALRILYAACWALTASLTYLLHRRRLGERLACVAGLLVAVSPVLLHLTTSLLSEGVFALIVVAVLVMTDGWREHPPSRWTRVVVPGLLTSAAILVRAMGFALVPFTIVTLLRHRSLPVRRRLLVGSVFVLCALAPTLAWQVRQARLPAIQGYSHQWLGARASENTQATGVALQLERLRKYGPLRLESLKEVLVPRDLGWRAYQPPLEGPTNWLIGGGLLALGAIRYVRLRIAADGYVLLSLLILAFWPWPEGVRFIAPLIPVVIAYPLWLGCVWWRRQGTRRWERTVSAAGLLGLFAIQVGGVLIVQGRLPAQRQKAEQRVAVMKTLADWHAVHTPPGATWFGITPDRDESKVLLLGAAYLADRRIETIDVQDRRPMTLDTGDASCVFIHESLLDGPVGFKDRVIMTDRIGPFVVMRRTPG